MAVKKLGIFTPEDYDREAPEELTEFRFFLEPDMVTESDEVDATFNVYKSSEDDSALIGWDLEAVGLVTWHRADSLDEAEAWVYEQIKPFRTWEG